MFATLPPDCTAGGCRRLRAVWLLRDGGNKKKQQEEKRRSLKHFLVVLPVPTLIGCFSSDGASEVRAAASGLSSRCSSCTHAFLPLFPLCQYWPIQSFQSTSGNVHSKIFFFLTKIMIIIWSNWPNTGFFLLTAFSQVMKEGEGQAEAVYVLEIKLGKLTHIYFFSRVDFLHFPPDLWKHFFKVMWKTCVLYSVRQECARSTNPPLVQAL